jgi:ATP adenylyltransferase
VSTRKAGRRARGKGRIHAVLPGVLEGVPAGIYAQRPGFAIPHILLPCRDMDYLWTPWRYAYVTNAEKITGCIFCELPKLGDDAKARIVHRGRDCYIVLNSFPYTPGHVMIVPFAHLDELQKLSAAAAHEMMEMTQQMEGVLRSLYTPDGINVGMNVGKAAGAGVAGHIHMHALPRWVADGNFLSVVGETRILPETLDQTYARIKGALG